MAARARADAEHDQRMNFSSNLNFVDRDVEAKGKDSGPVFTADDEAA